MSDVRLALLPLTGAGERECQRCRHLDDHEAPFAPACQLTGYGLASVEGRAQRDASCLSAERDAARLRAVEAHRDRLHRAALDFLVALDGWESNHATGQAIDALRAALKETP